MTEADKDDQTEGGEESKKPPKGKAKKPPKDKAKKPQRYSLVVSPVRPTIEVADGPEELLELLRQHADILGVPESNIYESGLFSIFKGEGIELKCVEARIELPS